MNRTLRDAKRLLLGEDGSESIAADFKEELTNSLKDNIISKAMATLLITARNNADALGEKIIKRQERGLLGKGSKVSKKEFEEIVEENQRETKKEEIKKEIDGKEKKKRQESLRQTMQRIAAEDELRENNMNFKHKEK